MATIVTRAGKGSALTWTEGDANITNLNNAKLESENSGSTGQVLTKTSTGAQWETFSGGASALNDLSDVTLSGPGADQVLKYDTLTNQWINGTAPTPSIALDGLSDVTTTTPSNGQALIYNGTTYQWENQTISSGGIGNVVEDTTPQLGGNLDVNGQQIVSVSNGNIVLAPDGSGVIRADKSVQIQAQGELRLSDSDSSNYVGFKSPATVSSNKVWTLPSADGTNGQVLSTNGSGTLAWATAGGTSISSVVFQFSSPDLVSGSIFRLAVSELLDTGSIASVSSTYNFTLPAGTYLIIWQPDAVVGSSIDGNQNTGYQFFSISGDSTITGIGTYLPALDTAADDSAVWNSDKAHFTLTQTSTFEFRFTRNGTNATRFPAFLTLMKVA